MKNLNSTRIKKEKPLKGFDLGLLTIGYKHLSPSKKNKKSA